MELVRPVDVPMPSPAVAPNGGGGDERGVFHVEFDPDTEPVSQVVIESVATIQNTEMEQLEPLHATIDPEPLDALIPGEERRSGVDSVEFAYEGMEVVVEAGGDLWLQWQ